MVSVLEREVQNLSEGNREQLKKIYSEFQERYKKSLEPDNNEVDKTVYRGDSTDQYGIDFLSYIDPQYTKDIMNNIDWYLENHNEILLNVVYPSKQEKEFLKHIESV